VTSLGEAALLFLLLPIETSMIRQKSFNLLHSKEKEGEEREREILSLWVARQRNRSAGIFLGLEAT
jgi:hypothetical protein